MADSTLDRINQVIGTLTSAQLEEMLHFVEALAGTGGDLEAEESWLLYSGALKRMVDEIAADHRCSTHWRSRA